MTEDELRIIIRQEILQMLIMVVGTDSAIKYNNIYKVNK